MRKRIVIALSLLAVLVLLPVSSVLAKPKTPILITGLSYHSRAPMTTRVPGFVAEGEGTIDCNGIAACIDAGLDEETVTIVQAFWLDKKLSDDSAIIPTRTAGTIQLPGELPAIAFKGKGTGTAECVEGVCRSSLVLDTRTKRGKLIFRLDIDHSSAGVIDSMEGDVVFIGGDYNDTRYDKSTARDL